MDRKCLGARCRQVPCAVEVLLKTVGPSSSSGVARAREIVALKRGAFNGLAAKATAFTLSRGDIGHLEVGRKGLKKS
jgi:hypothetical protein